MKQLHVVVGGPAGSGKSTFTCSLYIALMLAGPPVGLHELDVYSDTHGPLIGTKPWEQRHRKRYARYDTTIRPVIDRYEADESPIVIGDLPGKLANPWLAEMCAGADVMIIVGREKAGKDLTNKHASTAAEWEKKSREMGKPVIARVLSMLSGQAAEAGAIAAHGLNRALQPLSPAVQEAKATILAHLSYRRLTCVA